MTLCSATAAAAAAIEEVETLNTDGQTGEDLSKAHRGKAKLEVGPNMKLDMELYEGIVSQPIIEPTVSESVHVTWTSGNRQTVFNDEGCLTCLHTSACNCEPYYLDYMIYVFFACRV